MPPELSAGITSSGWSCSSYGMTENFNFHTEPSRSVRVSYVSPYQRQPDQRGRSSSKPCPDARLPNNPATRSPSRQMALKTASGGARRARALAHRRKGVSRPKNICRARTDRGELVSHPRIEQCCVSGAQLTVRAVGAQQATRMR
jgi:hypothetical protein